MRIFTCSVRFSPTGFPIYGYNTYTIDKVLFELLRQIAITSMEVAMAEHLSRTKADWKALRETIGISTGSLASYLDKNISTVQYWENPGHAARRYHATKKAWDMLLQLRRKQQSVVEELVNAAINRARAEGTYPFDQTQPQSPRPTATLYYYRNRAEYYRSDRGDIGILNTTARQAALRLEQIGFDVRFRYDDSESDAEANTSDGADKAGRGNK